MDRFISLPWVGVPKEHPIPKFLLQSRLGLYMPFHSPSETVYNVNVDLDKIPAVKEWRAALDRRDDFPFWGPSAFTLQENDADFLRFRSSRKTRWSHVSSSSNHESDSHLSAALGVGVGNNYFGATVSGKYDHSVSDKAAGCLDSTNCHTVAGYLGLTECPHLSKDAMQLLVTHGPDLFKVIYGTHFVSECLVGANSGYSISVNTTDHSERESFSAMLDIKLLFCSIHVEQELISRVEAHCQRDIAFVSYDSLTETFEETKGSELLQDLEARAKLIRGNLAGLEGRLRVALPSGPSQVSQLQSEASRNLVQGVLLAPWAILHEWQQGVANWEHYRPAA